MARSLIIVVSGDPGLVQKTQQMASKEDVSVKVFTHEEWNRHLEDKTFRNQVLTGSQEVGGATILPFPGVSQQVAVNTKSVSSIDELEGMAIKNAIFEYRGNLTEAAKALGIGRATLYRKVKQYDINPSLARKRKTAKAA